MAEQLNIRWIMLYGVVWIILFVDKGVMCGASEDIIDVCQNLIDDGTFRSMDSCKEKFNIYLKEGWPTSEGRNFILYSTTMCPNAVYIFFNSVSFVHMAF